MTKLNNTIPVALPREILEAFNKAVACANINRPAQPVPAGQPEGQKDPDLGDLYDDYRMCADYIAETLNLLYEIAADSTMDMPPIGNTLDRIEREMRTLDGLVRKAFAFGGLECAGGKKDGE